MGVLPTTSAGAISLHRANSAVPPTAVLSAGDVVTCASTSVAPGATVATTRQCSARIKDLTAPKAPQVTFGGPYTECMPNSCLPAGGPGAAGTFTFSPADGDRNVVAYEYHLSGGVVQQVQGSRVTVSVVPQESGTQMLHVRAQDTLGRWGFTTTVIFKVA